MKRFLNHLSELNMTIPLMNVALFFESLPDRLRKKKWWIWSVFILLTLFLSFGMKDVVIDESLEAYFHKDDPVKKAYDHFRSIFGGDEYVYIVYKKKNGDIFSQDSLTALKNLHEALENYRLALKPGEPSPLDHIDEVKSLINVQYMEGTDQTLVSRNFIGDRIPKTAEETTIIRNKALRHEDYPRRYVSPDSKYGGILIRTDFNAERISLDNSQVDDKTGFDSDDDFSFEDETNLEEPLAPDAELNFKKSDIREYAEFMTAIRTLLKKNAFSDIFEFYLAGNPVMMDFFTDAVINDTARLMSLVLLLIILVLWLLFRSFSAVLWPVCIIVLTIVFIIGLIGWINIPMSAMIQIIVFLALSVGIADSVHILSGYLYFRNRNFKHDAALRAVMKKSGLACLLTSLTTAIGLSSLVLVPLKPIALFGCFAALSVMIAFMFTVMLLPLMLDIWSPVSQKVSRNKDHIVLNLIKKIETIGFSHARIVILIFLVAGCSLFWGLMQLKVDSNFVEIIKKGLPLRTAYNIVDTHMGGTVNLEIMLDFKTENALKNPEVLMAVEDLQTFMKKDPDHRVIKTMSLVNVVKESFRVLNNDRQEFYRIPAEPAVLEQVLFLFENANPKDRKRLVTDDYAKARIGLNAVNVGSIEALEMMASIQAFIDQRFRHLETTYPELNVTLTGNMALLAILLDYIAWAQIKSFGLALIVISVILLMVLGSSKAGVIALAPNLFPILTSFGLMGFLNIPLDADTLIVAPIIIGLAVDDTIHFLTHYRLEFGKSKDIFRAAVKAIREAGQAITFTSLILSSGFLVFLLSFHNGLSRFGIFAAIAIMTALISDLFLLPALCRMCRIDFKPDLTKG